MMKTMRPQPFTFEAGERAVLLLHGFTGHSADVRMLGRFLQKNGYTSHAPIYPGHGQTPDDVLQTNPQMWWESVLAAYEHVKQLGYAKIAVAGLSLGGVFSLKLGYTVPIAGIITMCAPMIEKTPEERMKPFLSYVRQYEKTQNRTEEEITRKIEAIKRTKRSFFAAHDELFQEVRQQLDFVYAPIFVAQASVDPVIDEKSAAIIYREVSSYQKNIHYYENGTHALTLSPAKNQLHVDILHFLNELEWN